MESTMQSATIRFTELLDEQRVLRGEALTPYASDYTEEDPRPPGLAVRPQSTAEVQQVVALAAELGLPLAVRVTGSNVGALAMPPAGGLVVDLSLMNRIHEVNVEDMYALIEPGVTWEQLKAHLEQEEIPLRMGYPLSPPDTSIVANCLLDGLGNLSMRHGSMADWMGGLEVVLPDGRLLQAGANAASDVWFGNGPLPHLMGLFANWQGTTGVVTRMAFQLWPLPPHRQRLFVLLYDRNGAFAAMKALARRPLCDDVGGLSWPTGKMLFDVPKPAERDPAEPEFFLYLDLSGSTEKELSLRREMLEDLLSELQAAGYAMEAPLDIETLVRLNPRFGKFADFPTRLEFLVDTPGGGLSWVGTYGPLSRFERYADRGWAIMQEHGFPPAVVSRPMKGGHFGVLRFLSVFDKSDAVERARVREMNLALSRAGYELGFLTYKTPAWAVELLQERLDPTFMDVMTRVRALLDPQGIMAPHCWAFSTPAPAHP
jgi:FAD/FMN-containing dehydrogenase